MKNKRLLLKLLSTAITGTLLLGCCALASCTAKNGGSSSNNAKTEASVNISFSQPKINMSIGETKLLNVHYNRQANEKVQWTSDNPEVVAVSDGVLKASKLGKAKITASYGKDKATCEVEVGLGEYLPTLQFNDIFDDTQTVTLFKNESLDLRGNVCCNGITFTDATFTYEVGNETLGSVAEGMFTATAVGKTEIQVKTVWNGEKYATLQKTLNVEILEPTTFTLTVNGTYEDELTFHLPNDIETYPSYDFVVEAKEENDVLSNVVVETEETYLTYANGVLSIVRPGTSFVNIKATLSSGAVVNYSVKINVVRPVKEYAQTLAYFSALDGDSVQGITLSDVVNGERIIDAVDEYGNKLTVMEGKVYGVQTKGYEKTQTSITVYTAKIGVKVDIIAYTKLIDEATDFEIFNIGKAENFEFDGYYMLLNDIDANEYVHVKHDKVTGTVAGKEITDECSAFYDSKVPGLTGTFNGNGYTVDSITVGQHGIFGIITSGSVIDTAFTNVQFKNESTGECLLAYTLGVPSLAKGVVANVYAHTKTGAKVNSSALLCANVIQTYSFYRVILDMSEMNVDYEGKSYNVYFYPLSACDRWYVRTNQASNYTSNVFAIYDYPMTALTADATDVADAEYVDGKKADTQYVWSNARRYTSFKSMYADEKVSFETFGSKCWDTGENKDYAIFKSAVKYVWLPMLNEQTSTPYYTEIGTSNTLSVYAQGLKFEADSIRIVENNANATLNGAKLTATEVGTVKIEMTYQNTVRTLDILVVEEAEESAITLKNFSALDGDVVAGEHSLSDIIGGERIIMAVDALGNPLTVSADNKIYGITTLPAKRTDTQIFIQTETRIHIVNIEAYTQVIDEVADLDMFKSTKTENSLNGYYILANDIDFNGETFNQYTEVDGGTVLKGTFDGNGHTISNIKISGHGLFYSLWRYSVVKNLALTNVTLSNTTSTYVLSDYTRGTIENVYIEVNDAVARLAGSSVGNYAVMGTFYLNGGSLQNVVVDMLSGVDLTKLNANVYGLSQKMSSGDYGASSNVHVISNGTNNALKKAKYYASYEEMQGADNDYSSFTAPCWQIFNKVPVWDNAKLNVVLNGKACSEYEMGRTQTFKLGAYYSYVDVLPIVDVAFDTEILARNGNVVTALGEGETELKITLKLSDDKQFSVTVSIKVDHYREEKTFAHTLTMFSALDGDTVGSQYGLKDVIGEEDIEFVKNVDGERLEVVDNKIFGIKTSSATVVATTLNIYTPKYIYTVNIEAYTKVIDEVADLDIFKSTTETNALNGYYILANDIDFNGATFMQYQDADGGTVLNGTFDGNGYSIRNIKIFGRGLFYKTQRGSTIKNLAITNVTLSNSYVSYVIADYTRGTIENVYVQVSDAVARSVTSYKGEYAVMGAFWVNGGILKNVVVDMLSGVDVTKLNANIYGLYQTLNSNDYGYSSNVYVISKGTNKALRNVKYYATSAEMDVAGNDYASFDAKYWQVDNGVLTWKGKSDN